jgi:hypothetical protein
MGKGRITAVMSLVLMPASLPAQPQVQLPKIYKDCAAEARAARARGDQVVVVCGDREARSPDRWPESRGFDPGGPVQSVSRERHSLYEVGETGIGSCGTVGPGGFTGCMHKSWKQQREQYGK